MDSADNALDDSPDLAEIYLDSIPLPIEDHVSGHLAHFYEIKGLINDRRNEKSKLYQNFLLALNYAKQEKNYKIAGKASIELFYNTYIIKEDSSAFQYLDQAKDYFTRIEDTLGLAEVLQMHAYIEFYKSNYTKSNNLILEHLEHYKSLKDDQFYYLYALFMLSSNYLHLDDIESSHKYFNKLKRLKNHETIPEYLYDMHEVTLLSCMAHHHLEQKAMDSTLYYLKKSGDLKQTMNSFDIRNHFNTYINYFNEIQDIESKTAYVDSLKFFENKVLEKNVDASLTINKHFEKSLDSLENESSRKRINRNWIMILLFIILISTLLFVLFYKKNKKRIQDHINRINKASYLKSNHDKLKVKVIGLEQYILDIKNKTKTISTNNNPSTLRQNIKDLYKDIHLKSSTELTNGENHLELINELNVGFFTKIKELHPELNDSETIICYYIFTGFKNKDMASMLNVSIRSVESKRFRIGKKINLQNKEITLAEYLNKQFQKET